MATTQRATRIEKEENITALLLDIVSAVEVLALLIDDEDEQKKLMTILDDTLALKYAAIARRNQPYKSAAARQDDANRKLAEQDAKIMEHLSQLM